MLLWGEKIPYACGMPSDLPAHTLNHTLFACGSFGYFSETVAASDDDDYDMVELMESMVYDTLNHNGPSVL